DQFSIRLGHNTMLVTRQGATEREQVRGRSDLLLKHNGRPVAIVETKAKGQLLSDNDAWQGISYARLLPEMAPYTIVTNGVETRVYDPYAKELSALDSPVDQNGEPIPSIQEDLPYEAARILIGLNAETLKRFCREQLARGVSDLKGGVYEGRFYVPDLYIS